MRFLQNVILDWAINHVLQHFVEGILCKVSPENRKKIE